MRKLIEVTFMSLDGVVDAPGLVEQAQPYFLSDEEHSALSWELLSGADALLLGRKTYEFFAKAYPAMAGSAPGVPSEFIDRMNAIPKYVASRTLREAKWNATILKGDIVEEVIKIKQQPGQDIRDMIDCCGRSRKRTFLLGKVLSPNKPHQKENVREQDYHRDSNRGNARDHGGVGNHRA